MHVLVVVQWSYWGLVSLYVAMGTVLPQARDIVYMGGTVSIDDYAVDTDDQYIPPR